MHIELCALGCEIPFVNELKKAIASRFGASVSLACMELYRDAFVPERKQYDAAILLDSFCWEVKADKALGITSEDLFIPGLNFVFGLARDRCCVLSYARLAPSYYGFSDDGLFKERVIKEAFHELGHTFGLKHCQDKRCVMTFSNSIAGVDEKSREFCSECEQALLRALKRASEG